MKNKHDASEVLEIGNFTAYIIIDDDVRPPWEDYDQFGTIAHWHRRDDIGGSSEKTSPTTFVARAKRENLVYLPLAFMEHGGRSIWIGNRSHWSDPGGWDSGQVGYIYATPETIRKEFSCRRITRKVREKAETILRNEVAVLDMFYQGEVYGIIIEDKKGEEVDACWGFYGFEHAQEEAKDMASSLAE